MKKAKLETLSPREMIIARMLVEKKSLPTIAEEMNLCSRTIFRTSHKPIVVAYMERVREENHAMLGAERNAELKRVGSMFTFADAATGYLKIYNNSKYDVCKLRALDSLVALFGIKAPTVPANVVGEGLEKPDVYRAEWLTQ